MGVTAGLTHLLLGLTYLVLGVIVRFTNLEITAVLTILIPEDHHRSVFWAHCFWKSPDLRGYYRAHTYQVVAFAVAIALEV